MREYNYSETHSILQKTYLDEGNEVRRDLIELGLEGQEFDEELNRRLRYVYARIPTEFWSEEVPSKMQRSTALELDKYIQKAPLMRSYGLGLTLISTQPGYKSRALYILIKQLADLDMSCFTISFTELSYLLKEARDNDLLAEEVNDRLAVDFFCLLDIYEGEDLPSFSRQDVLALLELRIGRTQPILLSVDSPITSLNDLLPNSFLNRFLLAFSRVNKLVIAETLAKADDLYQDKWRQVDD